MYKRSKRFFLFFLIFSLLVIAIQPAVFANSNKNTIHLKLDLDKSNSFLSSKLIKKGNKDRFGLDAFNNVNGFIELTLVYEINDEYADLSGNGVIKLETDTFPISYNGSLKINHLNNTDYIFGPIEAKIKNRKGSENALLGLYLNFNNYNDSYFEVTSGPIDFTNGNGMLFFGENKSNLLKQIITNRKENAQNKNNTSLSSNPITQTSVTSTSTTTNADVTLRGSAYTFRAGYHEYDTDPGTYSWMDHKTLVMNVYDLDPATNGGSTGTVQIRTWSNTPTLEDYMVADGASRPYVDVDKMTVTFGTDSDWMSIDKDSAAPLDSSKFELSTTWDYVAFIPGISSQVITILANAYQDLYNANPAITSDETTGPHGRVYQLSKHVRSLNKAPDLPSKSITLEDTETQTSGGLSYSFDYFEYTTSTSKDVFVNGQCVYFGNSDPGYSIGWWFTPEITYSWTIDLP